VTLQEWHESCTTERIYAAVPEDEPLPFENKAPQSIEEVRQDIPGTFALIWRLQMELQYTWAELKATKEKLDEVVSAQIGYLDR
jgi:hypothetical protein